MEVYYVYTYLYTIYNTKPAIDGFTFGDVTEAVSAIV